MYPDDSIDIAAYGTNIASSTTPSAPPRPKHFEPEVLALMNPRITNCRSANPSVHHHVFTALFVVDVIVIIFSNYVAGTRR